MRPRAICCCLAFLFYSSLAAATYDSNLIGQVATIKLYTDADYIYFTLGNQPTSHPSCNPGYFAIPATVAQNRRNQALAVLLAGKHSGEQITVGYDGTGNCYNGFILVHAVVAY